MRNYKIIIALVICAITFASIMSSQMIVKADNEELVTEKYDSKQSRFDFEFSTNEATGTIKSFDVSDNWNCQEMCSRRIPKILDRQESGGVMRDLF